MAEAVLKVERDHSYAIFTLNRPAKFNALNRLLLGEFDQAIAAVEADDSIRGVIVRGAGGNFCVGVDLAENWIERPKGESVNLEAVLERFERLPLPTIAAIEGAAVGVGCQIAMRCDIRIAAPRILIGIGAARLGVALSWEFTHKLIEIVGAANTAEILYTAQPVGAERALAMRLINQIVPADRLYASAAEIAEQIAANAPLPLRLMKKSLARATKTAFNPWRDDILEAIRATMHTHDAAEGIRAFLEKRRPVWRGH